MSHLSATYGAIAAANVTSAPIAIDDAAVVDESGTTTIDIVTGGAGADAFIGAKADLTVTIIDDSAVIAAGHSISVDQNNDINFVASAVSADEQVSFTYTIEDANGVSNVATVTVTVLDASAPAPNNANCYPDTGLSTVVVGSGSGNIATALAAAVNAAPAGRHILIASGTYTGGAATFTNSNGTEANPIVIRPQNALGDVTINNCNWTFGTGTQRLVLSQLFFNNALITVNGANHRIDRCRFRQVAGSEIVLNASVDGRISRCDFADYVDGAGGRAMVFLEPQGFDNGTNVRNLIDYCYFHDTTVTVSGNGRDLIRMFAQAQNMDLDIDVCTVDHCLFENNGPWVGENEIVSIKSGGWTFQFCTFDGGDGLWLNTRTSNNSLIKSCWFEDIRASGNAGLSIKGDNHLIVGNRFIGNVNCWISAGNGTADDVAGDISVHPAARNNQIVGNRMGSGFIEVGKFSGTNSAPAEDNNLFANTRDSGGNAYTLDPTWSTGTTFNDPGLSFTPAVKLTSTEVGLNAPDPLC